MSRTCNLSEGIKLVFSAPVPSHLKSLDHSMVESPNLTMVRVPCLKVAFWSTGSKMASRLSSTFSRRTGVPNWMQFSKSRMYGMFKRRACITIMLHAPMKERTSRCSRVNIQWVAINFEILSSRPALIHLNRKLSKTILDPFNSAYETRDPTRSAALMSGLLFFVHLLACICGSIINGHRRELSKMMALSMDKASFGR